MGIPKRSRDGGIPNCMHTVSSSCWCGAMEASLDGDLSHLLDHMGQSPWLEPDRANSSDKHIGTLQRNAAHPWSIHGMFAESGVQHEITQRR